MRLCALISLASVSCNTTKTFIKFPPLQYITFCCDAVVTLLFTVEMVAKMHIRGILKVSFNYKFTRKIFLLLEPVVDIIFKLFLMRLKKF